MLRVARRFGFAQHTHAHVLLQIRALCSTLLNCYLIQLLETGLLHVDPHPGNLMRTHDGKLVILDFGLMTEVGGLKCVEVFACARGVILCKHMRVCS